MDLFLPTGQRYCVNSSSLDFVPEIDEADGKVKVEETEYIKHEATLGGKWINSLINNKIDLISDQNSSKVPKEFHAYLLLPTGKVSICYQMRCH